jgi:hypothetical protein
VDALRCVNVQQEKRVSESGVFRGQNAHLHCSTPAAALSLTHTRRHCRRSYALFGSHASFSSTPPACARPRFEADSEPSSMCRRSLGDHLKKTQEEHDRLPQDLR